MVLTALIWTAVMLAPDKPFTSPHSAFSFERVPVGEYTELRFAQRGVVATITRGGDPFCVEERDDFPAQEVVNWGTRALIADGSPTFFRIDFSEPMDGFATMAGTYETHARDFQLACYSEEGEWVRGDNGIWREGHSLPLDVQNLIAYVQAINPITGQREPRIAWCEFSGSLQSNDAYFDIMVLAPSARRTWPTIRLPEEARPERR